MDWNTLGPVTVRFTPMKNRVWYQSLHYVASPASSSSYLFYQLQLGNRFGRVQAFSQWYLSAGMDFLFKESEKRQRKKEVKMTQNIKEKDR